MLLKIIAPLDGWCTPLDEVPDAVFGQRMLGDGLAIDPTGSVVFAPCDGEVITLPGSSHAVSIRSPQGIEVLIHVGIDTVQLGGRGFTALVKPGGRVKAGAELIRVDLDILARAAKSLMTPVVVTSEGLALQNRRATGLVKAGEVLFEIATAASTAQQPARRRRRRREAACSRRTLASGIARAAGGTAGAQRQRPHGRDISCRARPNRRCAQRCRDHGLGGAPRR